MQSVQLVLSDPAYLSGLREALTRTGPWSISAVETPDTSQRCVIVMDEDALQRADLPLAFPERVVLVARKDPQHLSQAWEAGIVSVVSEQDPPNTVLLAIMAAALRVPRLKVSGGVEPGATVPAVDLGTAAKRAKH